MNPDQKVIAAADDAMAAIQEMTEIAQDRGELAPGPPRELATVIWVLLHGMAQLQITHHLREPRTVEGVEGVDALAAHLRRGVLSGKFADSPQVPPAAVE